LLHIDHASLLAYVEQLLNASDLQEGVLKIIITRGVGGRGYRLPEHAALTYCLAVFPSLAIPAYQQGVKVRVCQQVLASSPSLAGMKHLNRLEHILARAEWQGDDYAEGLLLSESGNLIEATASNVFLVRDGQLFTPDLTLAGVAGIMRRLIVAELAPAMGVSVLVASLTLADVELADEVFVCNSVVGIWPVLAVTGVERQSFPLGAITQALQQLLEVHLASCSRQSSVNL
jgi:4-amino-4-deoxychorismate lyase